MNTCADYSHSVRLVHETAIVDGVPMRVVDILTDPILHPLLSDEGRFTSPRVPGVASAVTPTLGNPIRLRRLSNSEVTPAITAEAVHILREHRGDPYGTQIPFVADGKVYVAVIEQHYHPPGGPQTPWGYHPGVSVFEPIYA